jgi:hypothetical protein
MADRDFACDPDPDSDSEHCRYMHFQGKLLKLTLVIEQSKESSLQIDTGSAIAII